MTTKSMFASLVLVFLLAVSSTAHAASAVESQTPVSGALGVSTTPSLTFVFDRGISATTSNITISPATAFSYSTASSTLTITPSATLLSNTTYTITLSGIHDGSGNVLSSYQSQFTTQNNYSIPLFANSNGGLNLISIPVQPSSTAIANVLGGAASSIDSVWSYDPTNTSANSSGWLVYYPAHPELSNLSTLATGYGYWVVAHTNTSISGTGSLFASTSTPPSRALQSNWNLVGYYQLPGQSSTNSAGAFSSIGGYSSLIAYDNQSGTFKSTSTILPGDAFWMAISSAHSYYPVYSPTTANSNAVFVPPTPTGALTATKYTGYGNQTMIAGQTGAKIGAFTLSTGAVEGITVNTINFTFPSSVTSTITNLTIKDESTGATLGSVIATPTTSNSYSVNLDVPVSSSKTIGIYADISSGANTGTIQATITTSTTGTGDTSGISASVTSTPLQTITLGSGTLSITRGAGDPVSNNVLAGASSVMVGEFNFAAANSPYTVQNVAVLIPNGAATSVTNVTLKYKDVNGAQQSVTQSLNVASGMTMATATFTGLTMYVPVNDSANIDVYVGTPTIASGATSGAGINVSLDTNVGTFRALNGAGSATTVINGGVAVASNGTFVVRKSIPTFAMVNTNTSVPSSGSPLYKFTVSADAAGAVEWTKLKFNIGLTNATITNLYLADDASGNNLQDGTTGAIVGGTYTVNLQSNVTQAQYAQIAAGSSKTYDLYGTVAGFTTGSTVTISLANDATSTSNGTAAAVAAISNVSWSDRSANSHTVSTSDWTSGYLLKNFTSNVTSYSK